MTPLAESDVMTLTIWRDLAVEAAPRSIPTASDDALTFWTPSLGPTATLMGHRLAAHVIDAPDSTMAAGELARTFGLTLTHLQHALLRMKRFGVATYEDRTVAVRLMLPPLARRHVRLLPEHLAAAYDP